MNILIWFLQIALAAHTLIGAAWKLSNPAESVGTLTAIPEPAWLALSVLEIFFALSLMLPLFLKRAGILAPAAAAGIAGEMLLFSGIHLASGSEERGPLIYWLVVTALCTFIIYARMVLRPHR